MIRFSIITITYNAESTLEPTIRSVAAQDYPGIEYIIVDGASKDGTLAIARRYADRIASLVSEPDKGLYDAMNKGLARATGDYVWFLNAGDTLHAPDTVSRIVAAIPAGASPDVIYGETALVDADRRFLGMRRLSAPERLTWRSFRSGMLVCHQAFIARRTLAEPYDLSYRFSADFDWCIRIMKQSRLLLNTHLTLVDYLSEGVTTANRRASLRERYDIMCRYYGTLPTLLRHVGFALRAAVAKVRGNF
jgi:glycosyltransferase involved in cell wall biosynthesis